MTTTSVKKKGLGRGLEALLGTPTLSALEEKETHKTLLLDQLVAGKYQPRTLMDEGALQELADSIREQGVIQPLLVRKINANQYEIIAGERRFRAAHLAGLKQVPVFIKEVSDEAASAMALIENIQREDLNPLEEAQGIQRLIEEFHFTHEQAAKSIGRSRSAVSNLLRLLNLAQPVQTMLLAGDLDMGHARALLSANAAHQITLANEIIHKQLSVRQAEHLLSQVLKAKTRQEKGILLGKTRRTDQDTAQLEEELSDTLAATVKIKMKRNGQGQLMIDFGSLDALDGILERLRQ